MRNNSETDAARVRALSTNGCNLTERARHCPDETADLLPAGGVLASREGSSPLMIEEESTPPILIGGVLHPKLNNKPNLSLTGTGYDAFTVSVPLGIAEQLLHRSEAVETGFGTTGFKQSEKRICMGGDCYRRFDPHTASKAWGMEYESWEYKGQPSTRPIRDLQGQECKPTRIDIAFDFDCPEDYFPSDFEDSVLPFVNNKGIDINYAGKRLSHTVYFGSRKSERMIRVYRRDVKNPLLAAEGRNILRVELELKKDMCLAFWAHITEHGPDSGIVVAAAHVSQMLGVAPITHDGYLPPLLRTDEDTEAVQMLLQFIKQNSVMIEACRAAGIDTERLAREKIWKSAKNRMQMSRLAKKTRILSVSDAKSISAQVVALL